MWWRYDRSRWSNSGFKFCSHRGRLFNRFNSNPAVGGWLFNRMLGNTSIARTGRDHVFKYNAEDVQVNCYIATCFLDRVSFAVLDLLGGSTPPLVSSTSHVLIGLVKNIVLTPSGFTTNRDVLLRSLLSHHITVDDVINTRSLVYLTTKLCSTWVWPCYIPQYIIIIIIVITITQLVTHQMSINTWSYRVWRNWIEANY